MGPEPSSKCVARCVPEKIQPRGIILMAFGFQPPEYFRMLTDLLLLVWISVGLLSGAGFLHLLPHLGRGGRHLSEAFCHAPLLDILVSYFIILPLVAGSIVAGWRGLIIAPLAMFATLLVWQTIHEAVHRKTTKGPRIIKVINKKFGALRSLTAIYVLSFGAPVLWAVRLAELTVYPPLVRLVNLPAYKAEEWINVSRQKFGGLVGHDLFWCLYCDWMTGVWSLGTEMLRNVESFWCPIRFACEKKCANCAIDFPDVNAGWVPASGNMGDVVKTLERMYPPAQEVQAWFGHPLRSLGHPILSQKRESEPDQASAVKS